MEGVRWWWEVCCEARRACIRYPTYRHVFLETNVHVLGRQIGVCEQDCHHILRQLRVLQMVQRRDVVTHDEAVGLLDWHIFFSVKT